MMQDIVEIIIMTGPIASRSMDPASGIGQCLKGTPEICSQTQFQSRLDKQLSVIIKIKMTENETKCEQDASSSVGLDTDKFETPRESDNESEVDVNRLVMGEAYDQLDEEARENISRVQGDLNVELLEKDDEQSDSRSSSEREEKKGRHDSSEEEVHTNIDDMLMYTIQGSAGEKSIRVLKFTGLFLPDTEKRRTQMERFNRKKMGIDFEFENESVRKRKREMKEGLKRIQKQHTRKAQYLPVNPFMEDFYFLQGYSKSGVAPQAGKKLQVPQGYKQLFTQNKFENSLLEKIIPSKSTKKMPQAKSVQFPPGQSQRGDIQELSRLNGRANAETDQKKDFTLEACQINELKSRIVEATSVSSNSLNTADNVELRKRLRSAKNVLKRSLEQKMPKTRISKIERQSFALLSNLRSIYEPGAINQTTPLKKGVLPSEVDIYELMVEWKFRQSSIATKRVKYWGELKDCVSEYQLTKDAHMIKRQEWFEFVKNKQTFKQPVFSLMNSAQSTQHGEHSNLTQKDNKTLLKASGTPLSASGQRVQNPETNLGGMAMNMNVPAQGRVRKTQQLVVEKSDFDLVTSFEEYQKLKNQEEMYYQQRKKITVTAESIMRHVRWKMGRISDKDFYKEECEEIKREHKIQIERAKSMQRQTPQRRYTMGTSSTEATETEPKDLENAKNQRNFAIEFEENLDRHFDTKRFEIQASILRRKTEKERASQQKQTTTQTPAYEPIVPEIHKESEEDHQASEPQHNSDNESSSSDSDSDSDESVKQQNAVGRTVLPSIADELNHAQCIKDLSFFKLNWDDRDLETFHRPNVQSYFLEKQNGQMQATAVSVKKEEKETRLNPHQYFKTRFKLSLNKGKFCIFEHIDQNPLFVNNFGMASRLKRYFYGDKQPTKKEFLNQKNENVRNRHIGPYGKLLMKAPLDRLDLLGQVDKTKYNGLTMLENNMYNAPVFYHRMPSTNNDFFCSIIKQPNNERRIVIRSLNSFYTVGQIEPKREVYNPQSRHFTHFIKQQSKAYTTRLLQENKIMSFHDIRQFFPDIGSPILKKGLKEIEVEQDRNGYCKLNANFEMERHKDRMTPEMICQYESAKHGQYRLARIGISEILSADKISYSTHKFCFEETDLILQRVAKLIESEVLQTPWNLSSNYIKIKQEGSMMMLEGQGDPSYGHGGYSYLKMPLKISADSIQGAKANRMNLNPAIQNPKAVTGTEADLRKLKKQTLFQILLEAGVQENELTTKTRWEMVAMLRCYASQNQPDSQFTQNGMKSFYARGVRNTSKKQQEMYNKRANSTFRKQMDTLSDPNPKDLHDLSEDQPNFTVLPDLEKMGLLKVGKGFGTSLTKSKKDKEKQAMLVQTKRDPGENAKDFTRDIFVLVNDESRKQIVEVYSMPEVKKIEDIKDYLKLFLVIHPNALSPQNQNPSGINIGGVSSNAEFLYAMNGNGSKEWEKKLLEKLNNREISKKCEILCHKIRSLTQEDGQLYKEDSQDGEKQYERIIFCADEKAIKKFRRCMNKNQMRQPRRTNRRNFTRSQTRPLTDENLRLQAAKNTLPSQGLSTIRSNSRSINSASIQRGGTTLANRNSAEKQKMNRRERGDLQIYSQPHRWEDNHKGSAVQVQSYRSILNSGSKSKSKKRSGKTLIATPQPSFKFAFTNNGVIIKPGDPQPALPIIKSQQEDELIAAQQNNMQHNKSTNRLPISLQVLPGSAAAASQPADHGAVDKNRISFRLDHGLNSQPRLGDDGDQVMDSQQGDENQSGESQDYKQLVNNEGVSEVRSEYEPEQVSEESSDYNFEQLRNSFLPNQKGQKKKKLQKQSSTISTKYENLNFVPQKQNSSLGRKNSRGNRKNPSNTKNFKDHGFTKDDYEYQNLTSNKSRRRQQQDGKQSLNNTFLEILDELWKLEESYLFQNQPTRQDAPNYRDLIKQPIALKDMKNKCKRHEYNSMINFEADIELMVANSEQFNGKDHEITKLACVIQKRAQDIMNSKKGDIEAMECMIQIDGAGQIL